MKNSGDYIQSISEEENDSYSDDSLFSISSWGADLSFRELIQRYEDDELVKPELQRHYVWDKSEASRFVDSILLGLPIPSIFLAQTKDERLLIIDGYQRIMTVRDYVKGVFSRDGKVFKLSRTEKINARWRGKAFTELSDADQRRIRNTTIHSIIFVQQEPSDGDTSLFQVFERINTSGRTLLPQEIRNCVAQGKFNDLLFELNKYDGWRKLLGIKESDPRMRDMEYILRFFALSSDYFNEDDKERLSLKKFLDLYMKTNKDLDSKKSDLLKNKFINAIDLIFESFGKKAFHNISPSDPKKYVPKFSPTIFDSIMIAANNSILSGSVSIPEDPEEARRQLLQNETYKYAITQETMRRSRIIERIQLAESYLFSTRHE